MKDREATPPSGPKEALDTVVVLLATFNGARHLPRQLASIAAQSHSAWRIVASDDGSQDETVEILEDFAARHPGRVRIVPGPATGSARDNFLQLLAEAEPASYFAFCDQDDVWHPDKLAHLVRTCRRHEEEHGNEKPCLVFSDLHVVGDDLMPLAPSFLGQIRVQPASITYRTLLAENAIPGCAMLFNLALLDGYRARAFDARAAVMHDWWLALLASTTGEIVFYDRPLLSYRQHEANTLGTVTRTGWAFVLTKLRSDRSTTLRTYEQAGAFVGAYGDLLDQGVRDDIRVYASLAGRPKIARIWSLVTRRLLKQGAARRLYQLLRA